MDISSMQRTELKRLMDRIAKAAADIKRAVHSFTIRETTYLQMDELVAFIAEAKSIMETLKIVEPDDSRQGVLLPLEGMEPVAGKVVYIPKGYEPEQEENDN